MYADLSCARLFFLFFLLFRCQMQREAANHFSLCVGEGKGCRSLAIVVLRNVEEYGCAERRVITCIGRTCLVGIGKTVIVSQPGFLRGKQETGVGLHGRVLGQLLEEHQIIEHPKRAPVSRGNDLTLARVDSNVAHLSDG